MIPRIYIQEHSEVVAWQEPRQIEQDLIIVKALLSIFSDPILGKELAFRGGTALNKLFFNSAARYSEDIDLVQVNPGPIGKIAAKLTTVMAWLGERSDRQISARGITLSYKTKSEDGFPIKLKFEINTREHFSILGFHSIPFISNSEWCAGSTLIQTYKHEELLATKLRALYQRSKGRDLYDLHAALTSYPDLNIDDIISCFVGYLAHENITVLKKDFKKNLEAKLRDKKFRKDIEPLLHKQNRDYDPDKAYCLIIEHVIEKLPK